MHNYLDKVASTGFSKIFFSKSCLLRIFKNKISKISRYTVALNFSQASYTQVNRNYSHSTNHKQKKNGD